MHLYQPIKLARWYIIFPNQVTREVNKFVARVIEISRNMGFEVNKPREYVEKIFIYYHRAAFLKFRHSNFKHTLFVIILVLPSIGYHVQMIEIWSAASTNWKIQIRIWCFSSSHRHETVQLICKFKHHTSTSLQMQLGKKTHIFECFFYSYSAIKKKCYGDEKPVSSQVATKFNLSKDKGYDSIVTKIAIQMCTKLGGAP